MQKLSGKSLLLVSFTLFSMFFGAGNLIFPPHLGAQAGVNLWPAFAGLAVSAVGLPIAGVVAVARAGGLDKLAGRVHPVFAQVFMILIYLSIGPCLAIPRTASTSFAMLTPLLGSSARLQLGYSVLFFGAAFLVALRPDRLTRWLGRLLCPCLLVLILILFGGCLLHPLAAQYADTILRRIVCCDTPDTLENYPDSATRDLLRHHPFRLERLRTPQRYIGLEARRARAGALAGEMNALAEEVRAAAQAEQNLKAAYSQYQTLLRGTTLEELAALWDARAALTAARAAGGRAGRKAGRVPRESAFAAAV